MAFRRTRAFTGSNEKAPQDKLCSDIATQIATAFSGRSAIRYRDSQVRMKVLGRILNSHRHADTRSVGTLDLEFRLQRGPHAVQDAFRHAAGEQTGNGTHGRQLAFAVEKRVLNLAQQVFGQIQRLLQR